MPSLKSIATATAAVLAMLTTVFIQPVSADLAYGITNNQFLVTWNTNTPGTLNSGFALSGLQANEQIVGIDFRPANNALYGIGSSNRLYQIDTATGGVTQVGSQFGLPLNGSQFGYDFNPVIDRSRIVTDTNKNYVIHPDTGGQTQVTDLFFASGDPNFGKDPNVVHIGYTNSFAGTGSTQLFGIDSGLDILVTQANSAGTLGTVGSLGLDITGVGGFDISGSSGIAYGAFLPNGSSQSSFYSVNLSTGQATLIGQIGAGLQITAFSLSAIPEPSSLIGLAGFALFGFARLRRRS